MPAEKPFAVCSKDNEPLISTFEFPKYEWFCQVCGSKYGWLEAHSRPTTDEITARYEELRAQYEIDRKGRTNAHS